VGWSSSEAAAQIACGDVITSSVTLTADLDCSAYPTYPYITIGADDVTLDGGGFSIIHNMGVDPVFAPAIRIQGVTNAVVRNITVSRGNRRGTGIYVADTTNTRLETVSATGLIYGVEAAGTANVGLVVRDSDLSGNSTGGRFLAVDSNFVLERNSFANPIAGGSTGLYITGLVGPWSLDASNDFVNAGAGACCAWGIGVFLGNTTDVTIDGVDVSATNGNGYALSFNNTTNTIIRNLTISGRTWGIYSAGLNPGLQLHNVYVSGATESAVEIAGFDPANLVLNNVRIAGNQFGRRALLLRNATAGGAVDLSTVIAYGGNIFNNSTPGVSMDNSPGVDLANYAGRYQAPFSQRGMQISNSAGAIVRNYSACSFGISGLWITNSPNVQVIDSAFSQNASGIIIDAASTGVTGNATFSGNTTDIDDPAGTATITNDGTPPDSDSDGTSDACDLCVGNDTSGDTDSDRVCDDTDNCVSDPNSDQAESDGDAYGDVCDVCTGDDDTGDTDNDLVCDDIDNCVDDANPDQQDTDMNGIGDVCQFLDLDNDGVRNDSDNCPFVANPSQADADNDGLGDACDPLDNDDLDGDGFDNGVDNCPFAANPSQADADNDGIGDDCDNLDNDDVDGDGVDNGADNCPFVSNVGQADADNDGFGDVCDTTDGLDVDGDGINNDVDNCPHVPNNAQADADNDGIGDDCDNLDNDDVDGDGVDNGADNCPFVANPGQEDADDVGDDCDNADGLDLEGDGVNNDADNCPFVANPGQEDADGDSLGDACDDSDGLDVDGDGVVNSEDNCPFQANAGQEDADGDGLGDACDMQQLVDDGCSAGSNGASSMLLLLAIGLLLRRRRST